MPKIFGWISGHKLLLFLLLVIGFLLLKDNFPSIVPEAPRSRSTARFEKAIPSAGVSSEIPVGVPAPPTNRPDRIVVKNTSLSLVVNNVSQTISDIESKTKQLGGFLVDSNLDISEGVASGKITVRVPEEKRQDAINEFKKLAAKIVSENVSGYDVTDQYVDFAAKLETLQKTKAKFEAILTTAQKVADILEVQKELINVQEEIDNIKGQQQYLEQSAKLTLISVNLSTDELVLPLAPNQAWRPDAIFKQAIRSLISTLRLVGGVLIWVAVFTPLWLPVLLIIWWVRRRKWNKEKV